MTNAPDMATLTASLERSLQNCSLNNHSPAGNSHHAAASSTSSHAPTAHAHSRFHPSLSFNSSSSSDANTTLVELNSHISLPYHWEQCLDLKTGEIYYINWRNGMKAKEDPRLTTSTTTNGYSDRDHYYSEEDDNEDEEEDEDDSYDSEGSSTEYSPPCNSRGNNRAVGKAQFMSNLNRKNHPDDVLVVAGCKGCLMYYMVPKHVVDCPKCTGQLLHFDRSENADASSL